MTFQQEGLTSTKKPLIINHSTSNNINQQYNIVKKNMITSLIRTIVKNFFNNATLEKLQSHRN